MQLQPLNIACVMGPTLLTFHEERSWLNAAASHEHHERMFVTLLTFQEEIFRIKVGVKEHIA